MPGFGILRGKKTYITAVVTVIGTVAGYLIGDVSAVDAAQLIVTALTGAFVRASVQPAA